MTNRDIIDIELQPSLAEFKRHLRITSTDQDALLVTYLKAAATSAEHHIGRCLEASIFTYTGSFTHTVTLDKVDVEEFPLRSVDSVKVDGVAISTDDYTVEGDTLTIADTQDGDAVEVVYRAGGKKMESDIKSAILLTGAKLFNNPVDSVETMPSVATNLLGPYRRWK